MLLVMKFFGKQKVTEEEALMAVKYDFSITFQTRSGYYSTDKAELRRLREAVDLRNYRNEIRETLGRMLPERGPGQRPVEVILNFQ